MAQNKTVSVRITRTETIPLGNGRRLYVIEGKEYPKFDAALAKRLRGKILEIVTTENKEE